MWTPLLENGFVDHVPVDVLLLACVAISFMALAVLGAWQGRRTAGWNVAVAYGALFLLYRVYLVPSGYYEWYVSYRSWR